MADRSITIKIGADVSGLVSGLKTAAAATKDLASKTDSWVGRNSASITTLSNGLGIAGTAMTAFAAVSVLSAARFDQAMSGVESATHESAQGMSVLREAALVAGRDTVYSATEAAGAIEELAKAGLSTADIVGGGLAGSLDLAAAGEIAVADAAETAATAMTQFGLAGSEVGHVADLLAAGAGKAQGGVSDMSMALRQSGLVASQMGLSIDETVGTLTAFASAGLIGSDAGTSFRTMLLRLANPSRSAATAMEDLGLSAYDAQGEFVGMASLADQLKSSLEPLPQAQRDAAMATIFGSDAIRAANVLYKQGADGIDGWIAAVDDAGYAAQTAAIRLDNLTGDWERLTGSVETALIGMGDGAQGPLRELVRGATEAVDAFSDLPDPVQQSTLALVGGGGLVLLGVAGMGKLAVQVHETKAAMDAMGISTKKAAIGMGAAGAAIGVAFAALSIWLSKQAEARARVDEFRDSLDDATGSVTESTRAIIANTLAQDRGKQGSSLGIISYMDYADAARILGITLEDVTDAIMGNEEAMSKVKAAMDAAKPSGESMFDVYSKQADAIGTIQGALDGQSGAIADAMSEWDSYSDAMGGAASSTGGARSAVDEYAAAVDDGTATVEMFNDALEEHIGLMSEAAGVVLAEEEAIDAYEKALDDATAALEENGATLDRTSKAGRDNRDALREIANAGWKQIESMQAAGRTNEELQGHMARTRQDLIDTAVKFGMSADEAEGFANELRLIPSEVKTVANVETATAMAKVGALQSALHALGSKTVSIPGVTPGPWASGYVAGKASGGLVAGPGSGTSDSVPAWLSNGEYVVRAAAVARYGVALMDSINSGSWTVGTPPPVRMASGGLVSSGPSGPLVQIGQIVAYDAEDAARRIADRQRDVLVSHGLVGAVL